MPRTEMLAANGESQAPAAEEPDGFPRDGGGPRAMTRVIRLCERLSAHPAGLTLSELSAQLDTPKSTLLNSLRPLVQDDFLIVDGPLYRLGPGAFRLAGRITSAWSLPRLMATYLRELWEQTQESVGLAVPDWSIGRAVYIDAIQSPRPVLYAMRVGVSGPFYASAAGRLMMAHAPADWLETYLQTTRFKSYTPGTETDPHVIRRELRQAREQGYWVSVSQLLQDTATVAAPVFDANGRIVAAVAIGAPQDRLMANLEEVTAAAVAICRRASGRLGSDRAE
ncbi:MAG TPA: IclR family transcriptional regulator [Acetobacteraceae bacterium]|nr:IclR family transcriptional regulator [Acetobacteraceae bacterium]